MTDVAGASGAHATLAILTHLSRLRGPAPAAAIAAALGLPRSSVYRLLGVLEGHGYVVHYPEAGRWGIGVAAFELSSGFARQEPLTRLGAPVLAALVDAVGESGHLAVLHGRDVVYLVEERAPHRPALVTDVGVRLPAHVTASGRAMLAALPPAQLRALFPDAAAFVAGARGGPGSYRALRELLQQGRERGFAAEDGDVSEGLASVAVAVLDRAGWPSAGIALTFDRDRVPAERWPELARAVVTAAAELARRIRGS